MGGRFWETGSSISKLADFGWLPKRPLRRLRHSQLSARSFSRPATKHTGARPCTLPARQKEDSYPHWPPMPQIRHDARPKNPHHPCRPRANDLASPFSETMQTKHLLASFVQKCASGARLASAQNCTTPPKTAQFRPTNLAHGPMLKSSEELHALHPKIMSTPDEIHIASRRPMCFLKTIHNDLGRPRRPENATYAATIVRLLADLQPPA
jgi:hypothetical protein